MCNNVVALCFGDETSDFIRFYLDFYYYGGGGVG